MDRLAQKSSKIYGFELVQLYTPGKQPAKVKARGFFCYWATAELGIEMTHLAGIRKFRSRLLVFVPGGVSRSFWLKGFVC